MHVANAELPGAGHWGRQPEKEVHQRHPHRLKVIPGSHQCEFLTFETAWFPEISSICNSGFCWKLVCFRLSWRTSWRGQRPCRSCEICHRKALLQLSLDVLHLNKNSISTDSSTNGPSLRNHDWRANPHLWFGEEVMGRVTVTRTSQTRVKTQVITERVPR